jgi:hypothetical protein
MNASFTNANFAISGAILIGCWAIGMFFFRFQRRTNDRFFGFFGWAFWILAIERILLLVIGAKEEIKPYVYLFRLVAFLFILYAIFDKNRSGELSGNSKPRDQDES